MTREEAIRFGENILKVADETTDADAIEFTKMAIKAFKRIDALSKQGHWIIGKHGFKCSNCLIVHRNHSIHCPSCGARMTESEVDSALVNRETT